MDTPSSDATFAGSIPELYDSLLVPLIFEPYAADLARRVAALNPSRVLETAAGTGVVTRAMARALPASADLVATDLNQAMLDRAAAVGASRPVMWKQADAMRLPFDDASFDVGCPFSVMFFADKTHSFSEARRVLRRGEQPSIQDDGVGGSSSISLARRTATVSVAYDMPASHCACI